ncbi:uncharacterized protein LOC118980276 isoform X2 [Sturnira hondurensis]|uniref:uncharacterized protein LOC118980276 isoform X2 n=1 Tax=Sturnira hondurensis TaxID=192404 RepID=UPI0018796BEC|nr:uncharacterized protein LOC118980276 isoform X2 [Sturnira hondurensis]
MKVLVLTVLCGLITALQALDPLSLALEGLDITGTWYVKAMVADKGLPKEKRPKAVAPIRLDVLDRGYLEASFTFLKKGQCHEMKVVMHSTEELGKFGLCRSPDANPEALEAFQKFTQSKGLPLEDISLPTQTGWGPPYSPGPRHQDPRSCRTKKNPVAPAHSALPPNCARLPWPWSPLPVPHKELQQSLATLPVCGAPQVAGDKEGWVSQGGKDGDLGVLVVRRMLQSDLHRLGAGGGGCSSAQGLGGVRRLWVFVWLGRGGVRQQGRLQPRGGDTCAGVSPGHLIPRWLEAATGMGAGRP